MRRLFLKGGILFLWVSSLLAQPPDTLWTKTFGGLQWDYGQEVEQTFDGGYIIVGYTSSFGSGFQDVYLVKVDIDGNLIWYKTYGGTDFDYGNSIKQTADSGYIIAGSTASFDSIWSDVYLIKTDVNGDTLWTRTYGEDFYSESCYSVWQTFDGGYVFITNKRDSLDGRDIWLIKTDVNGDTLWTKTYGRAAFDDGYSVRQTTDGGYIIAGRSNLTTSSFYDVYLVRTDYAGDTLWTKTYGGLADDGSYSVDETSDSCFIVTGYTVSYGAGYADVWLIKVDINGDSLWTKTIGNTDGEGGYSVQETSDGGYIITGWTKSYGSGLSDVYIIKTDADGDTIWTKTYGGWSDDRGHSIQETSDGGYIIAGYTHSFGAGNADVWLIKMGPDVGEEETFEKVRDFRIPGLVYGNLLRLSGITNNIEVKIFDILGREVVNQNISPQKSYIKLNNLTSGVYFLSIKAENPELHKFVLIR